MSERRSGGPLQKHDGKVGIVTLVIHISFVRSAVIDKICMDEATIRMDDEDLSLGIVSVHGSWIGNKVWSYYTLTALVGTLS